MNQTNNQTIVRGLLIMGAAAIVYFFFIRKKAKAATEAALAPAVTDQKKKTITVADKIATKSTLAAGTLSEAEIKKYATWIDRILQILAQSRLDRKNKYGVPTEEALSNADALSRLSDANLRSVVNYWKGIRGALKVLDMFVDTSGRLIALTYRLDELGLRK
ncbi:hypothetical protein [Nubsella zeaxanthinifaciens]|uniref:hypothetical protein n=1 Tax=Nubsella zeaxanthinifaciens TaxID=392412 RepID=UPI000DE23775|nr:hypothetical protein [Nubsella zeaxanthinifaciens]